MERTASSTAAQGNGAPAFLFSTTDFPERERLTAWREIFGRTVVKLDIEPIGGGPFHSRATVCRLPGFGLLFGSTSAAAFRHPREMISDDDLSFMVGPKGKWTASQLGRNPILGSGDGILMWNAEVGAITLPSRTRFTTFRVPVAAIAPLVPDIGAVIARRIPRETEALRLLTDYIGSLRGGEALATPELQSLVVTHIQDLLAVALGPTRDVAEAAMGRGVRAARMRAIMADILKNLDHPDLSVGEVAARHHLTPRYIQLLFEGDGTTFSEFLLGRRLARADRMLRDRRFDHRSITSVAFDVGFRDLSYFGRSFRRRFGLTPSDVRAEAVAAHVIRLPHPAPTDVSRGQ
jgi:AraC-like DNA-binding protein